MLNRLASCEQAFRPSRATFSKCDTHLFSERSEIMLFLLFCNFPGTARLHSLCTPGDKQAARMHALCYMPPFSLCMFGKSRSANLNDSRSTNAANAVGLSRSTKSDVQ